MAKPKAPIRCEDCGAEYMTRQPNTKYCSRCRLLRNLSFLLEAGNRTKDCALCEREFLPVARDAAMCRTCAHEMNLAGKNKGKCISCATEDAPLYASDIPFCMSCLYREDKRERLLKMLMKGRRDRRAENGVTA